MKTLILSIILLSITSSYAQQNQILVDGATSTNFEQTEVESLKAIVDTRKAIESLYLLNVKLNYELDDLERENARLKNQNYALKLRNHQLQDSDQIEVEQNKKQIRHNNKLIARNDKIIYQNAVVIQQNQQTILANKTLLLQQERLFASVKWAGN